MTKWEFYDHVTGDTINLEVNPSDVSMTDITRSVSQQGTTSPTGKRVMFEGRRAPQTMTLDGVTFTKGQYQTFAHWANKNYQFRLTDDLGRVFWVYVTRFAPNRRANFYQPWLADYSIEVTVLDWAS